MLRRVRYQTLVNGADDSSAGETRSLLAGEIIMNAGENELRSAGETGGA